MEINYGLPFRDYIMPFYLTRIDLASIEAGQTIKERVRCIFVSLAQVSVPQNRVAPFQWYQTYSTSGTNIKFTPLTTHQYKNHAKATVLESLTPFTFYQHLRYMYAKSINPVTLYLKRDEKFTQYQSKPLTKSVLTNFQTPFSRNRDAVGKNFILLLQDRIQARLLYNI